jgi:hypothetical protein
VVARLAERRVTGQVPGSFEQGWRRPGELVPLNREPDIGPAERGVVHERYAGEFRPMVAHPARVLLIRGAHLEDATQDVYEALDPAMDAYARPGGHSGPACSFRTFLREAVRNRLRHVGCDRLRHPPSLIFSQGEGPQALTRQHSDSPGTDAFG